MCNQKNITLISSGRDDEISTVREGLIAPIHSTLSNIRRDTKEVFVVNVFENIIAHYNDLFSVDKYAPILLEKGGPKKWLDMICVSMCNNPAGFVIQFIGTFTYRPLSAKLRKQFIKSLITVAREFFVEKGGRSEKNNQCKPGCKIRGCSSRFQSVNIFKLHLAFCSESADRDSDIYQLACLTNSPQEIAQRMQTWFMNT